MTVSLSSSSSSLLYLLCCCCCCLTTLASHLQKASRLPNRQRQDAESCHWHRSSFPPMHVYTEDLTDYGQVTYRRLARPSVSGPCFRAWAGSHRWLEVHIFLPLSLSITRRSACQPFYKERKRKEKKRKKEMQSREKLEEWRSWVWS